MGDSRSQSHATRRLGQVWERLRTEAAGADYPVTLLDLMAGISGKDSQNPQLLRDLQALFELPRQALRELDTIDVESAASARPVVRKLCAVLVVDNLPRPWREIVEDTDGHTAITLRMASTLLDQQAAEKEVDEAQVARVADEVRLLLDDMRRERIGAPSDVERLIEESLVAILRAIDEYWLRGPAGVEQELDRTLGRIERARHSETGLRSRFSARFKKVLTSAVLVCAMASDASDVLTAIDTVFDDAVSITSDSAPPAVPPAIAPRPADGQGAGGTIG